MRHQALRLGTLLDFLLDRLVQLGNGGVESIQQLQQIVPSAVGPRSQRKRLELLPSSFPPQPLLEPQPFVEGDRLQLIHDAGPRLHHAVPVPQQLPQIPVVPAWYPDPRKTIFHQQAQQQPCIFSICLRLAYPLGFNLRRIADPQLKVQLRQQSFKPACMPTGFHPHTHLHSMCRQLAVKLLRFLGVLQLQLPVISRFGIHKRNLLKARVIICSYNDHCPAPFYPSLWLVSTTKSTRAWEPALLWNQLRSKPLPGQVRLITGIPTVRLRGTGGTLHEASSVRIGAYRDRGACRSGRTLGGVQPRCLCRPAASLSAAGQDLQGEWLRHAPVLHRRWRSHCDCGSRSRQRLYRVAEGPAGGGEIHARLHL